MINLAKIKRRWVLEDGWIPADPALIGSLAIAYGITTHVIRITGVSPCLKYYWSDEEIFLSFQIEALREEEAATAFRP